MRNATRGHVRRLSLLASVAILAALLVPLTGTAQANHGDRKLDVQPETATRGVGASHTITARLCVTDEQDVPGNCLIDSPPTNGEGAIRIRFENENGPNDPDASTSRTTPDRSCSIFPNSDPASQCSISYVGAASGVDTWRAWIDHDDSAATDDSDVSEGRNETQAPGEPADLCGSLPGPAEPDCTDVVNVTWSGGAPAQVDCDDATGPDTERENNPSGGGSGNETYACEVRDAQGNLTGDADPDTDGNQQIRLHGENRNGVNDPDSTDGESYATGEEDYGCNIGRPNTGNEVLGKCNVTVTQNEGEEGTAVICFWVGTEDQPTGSSLCGEGQELTGENQAGDGSDTGNDLADQVDLSWQPGNSGEGGLDAEPETDSNPTGTDRTITGTIYDQFGDPAQENATISFEFFNGSPSDTDGNTPASADKTCTTVNSSTCTVTYTSPNAGRDLACVWIHDTPAMTGNNQGGTCDGEGLLDADDTAGSADPPQPESDDIDVVSKTWTNAPPATQLDCGEENDKSRRNQDNVISCTATDGNNGIANTNIDIELTGANDPDGSSQASPDLTCTTNGSGVCTVTHDGSSSNSLGKTSYRAWIDVDYFDQTPDADQGEQRDESTPAGAGDQAEPDGTDVMETTWIPVAKRAISLNSNRNSQKAGRKVRFSGDINGDPACESNQTVKLKARGNSGFSTIGTGTTNDSGHFEFEITIRNTRRYRADAPKSSPFGGTCRRARSNVVKVTVT